MRLAIESVTPATSEEWDAVWSRCPYATYFQSREWAEVWSGHTGGRLEPMPLRVTFNNGERALLPFSRRTRGRPALMESSPAGTYGGWLTGDAIDLDRACLLRDRVLGGFEALHWQLNPFDPTIGELGIATSQDDETHCIDLTAGFESVHAGWSGACRRAERKARRCGIAVRQAWAEAEWWEYFEVYRDSLRRWGETALSRFEWPLFQALSALRSEHLALWLAFTDAGQVAAGAIVGYAARHVVYWHGAARASFLDLRPANRLFHEVIRDACERGFRWFDFNSSAGLEGVRRFKEGFGARPLPCPYVRVGW